MMNETTIAMIKLVAVFAVLLFAVNRKWKLWMSVALASAAGILLFRIGPSAIGNILVHTTSSWETISMLLIFYLIMLLQQMLQEKDQMRKAQRNLDHLFHNRRINATIAPMLIGLLPSPAAASICGEIVDEACDHSLGPEDKAFVTSYFRHIPESFLPTYANIIMMSELAGVSLTSFTLGMLVPVLVMYLVGYWGWICKVPRKAEYSGQVEKMSKGKEVLALLYHLWTLLAIIVCVMVFHLDVLPSIAVVIAAAFFIYRFQPGQLVKMAKQAFDPSLLFSTWLIFLFKNILVEAGVIAALPEFFSALPIPTYLIFAFIFFFGSIAAGSTPMVAMCTNVAFNAISGAGMPLMMLLNTFSWAAMQLSPTHICIMIAAEYFHTNMGTVIRKTIIPVFIVCIAAVLYYLVLLQLA